jgi:hypothetical protein
MVVRPDYQHKHKQEAVMSQPPQSTIATIHNLECKQGQNWLCDDRAQFPARMLHRLARALRALKSGEDGLSANETIIGKAPIRRSGNG